MRPFHLSSVATALFVGALVPAALGQTRGEGDVALQGAYTGGSSQNLEQLTGTAIRFSYLTLDRGLLTGVLQTYGEQSGLKTGEVGVGIRELPWHGRYWDVMVGDFHQNTKLVDQPFTNLYLPNLLLRGVQVGSKHGKTGYTVFFGRVMLLTGPRIPFELASPQWMLGATAQRKIGDKLNVAGVVQRLWGTSNGGAIPGLSSLQAYGSSNKIEGTASYDFSAHVKLFADAAVSSGTSASTSSSAPASADGLTSTATDTSSPTSAGTSISTTAGAAYERQSFTVRANYTLQSATYLPVAGYFTGDRKGAFGELKYRPWRRLELYASTSSYGNNLAHSVSIPSLKSEGESGGVSLILPLGFNANGQYSTIRLNSQLGDVDNDSKNRQMSATISKSLFHQNLRFAYRDIQIVGSTQAQHQRSREVEDTFVHSRWVLGGGVRLDNLQSDSQRNSIFYHGTLQTNFRRFNLFANVEAGNDLLNKTVFATNTVNTTAIGLNAQVVKGWNLHVEGVRNQLISQLNPERAFLLGNEGLPVDLLLSGVNTWNFFFRLEKHMTWGPPIPVDPNRPSAQVSFLLGDIEGFVKERGSAFEGPAASVKVLLDGVRPAETDEKGKFRITDVAEGIHRVSLSERELLADYLPGATKEVVVRVQPKKIARADLEVAPTTSVEGVVQAGSDVIKEDIIIRLSPGNRYTTPDPEGHFGFYNLPEGTYTAQLDLHLLPAGSKVVGDLSEERDLKKGLSVEDFRFQVTFLEEVKAVRKVNLASAQTTPTVVATSTPVPVRKPAPAEAVRPIAEKTDELPEPVPAVKVGGTKPLAVKKRPIRKVSPAQRPSPAAPSVPSLGVGILPVHVVLAPPPSGSTSASERTSVVRPAKRDGAGCGDDSGGVSGDAGCEHPAVDNNRRRTSASNGAVPVHPVGADGKDGGQRIAAPPAPRSRPVGSPCPAAVDPSGGEPGGFGCLGFGVANGSNVTVKLSHQQVRPRRKRPVDVSGRRTGAAPTNATAHGNVPVKMPGAPKAAASPQSQPKE